MHKTKLFDIQGCWALINKNPATGENMNIKTIFLIAMVLLSLPFVANAKPVIVGYNGNLNDAILEEHNISNYTVHQQINAFSTDISESTIEDLFSEKKIRYIEDDISIGVVGVAYDSELYAVKVLDSTGNGQISDVIEGIEWAVANDMDIISMSIGTTAYSQAFEEACDHAYSSDVLLVAASGNSGDGDITSNNVEYPAKFDSVMAVSAIDSTGIAPIWSSDGDEVELAAPGVSIYSTFLNDDYTTESGTSMATPFVAGVAALVKSENQSMTSQEVRELLCSTATDIGSSGKDPVYGFGLVTI